jgi:hypothetical protein
MFLFVGMDEGEVYGRKVDVRNEFLARILDAATYVKKREDYLQKKTDTIFINELKSALMLTVVFSNIHCDL